MIDDIVFGILICVLVVLVLSLVWLGFMLLLKDTAPSRKDFWFIFHGIPRHVKVPNLRNSKYWDRFPTGGYDQWKWRATLDCQAMIELARELDRRFEGKSEKYRASYILAMVQQNTKYIHDSDLYGCRDRFAFPVCVSYLHKGDCEDSALLGACLSNLCGLDTVIIYVRGHMAYGVNLGGVIGAGVMYQGNEYKWCESTSVFPIGVMNSKIEDLRVMAPEYPPETYLLYCTEQDKFEQYK